MQKSDRARSRCCRSPQDELTNSRCDVRPSFRTGRTIGRWPRFFDRSHLTLRRSASHPAGPERARVDWPPVAQRAQCTIDYTSGSGSTWCLPSTRPVCARPYALSRGVPAGSLSACLSVPIRIPPPRRASRTQPPRLFGRTSRGEMSHRSPYFPLAEISPPTLWIVENYHLW